MSTAPAVLFLTALLGVLVVVGLALAPLGWIAEAPYLLVVALGVGLLVRRARVVKTSHGRTCNCCTSTVFDPVEVR
jgi:hypothetical protein